MKQMMITISQMSGQGKFTRAFAHVKSCLPENKQVTIGASLGCFTSSNISDELKCELGVMIIAMIAKQKDRLDVPAEALTQIVQKIVEDMPMP